LTITSAAVAMNLSMQGGGFSMNSSTQVEVKDDALLGEIMSQASMNRPVVKIINRVEMPKMNTGAAMSMAMGGGGNMQMMQNYDCFFGPPTGQPIDTFMTVIPLAVSANVQVSGFGANMNVQQMGLESLQLTMQQKFTEGYRMVALLPGATSTQQSGMMNVNSQTQGSLKAIFQKSDWQAYSESMFMTVALNQTVGMGGITVGPFDLLKELNAAGAVGWELAGIVPIPTAPPSGQIGIGSTITSYHCATLSRRSNDPVQYKMVEVPLKVAVSMAGATISGSIIPTVQAAANAGWTFVGYIMMPARQNGMSQVLPARLYFQSRSYY
jgi:hypothetical protein